MSCRTHGAACAGQDYICPQCGTQQDVHTHSHPAKPAALIERGILPAPAPENLDLLRVDEMIDFHQRKSDYHLESIRKLKALRELTLKRENEK